jgi:hypothetical protein
MSNDDTEKLGEYAETILEFTGPGPDPIRIDLRRPLTAADRAAVVRLGLDGPFAVLTAENPGGEHADEAPTPEAAQARAASNHRRTARLLDHLEQVGARAVPVDGVAPGGDHRERCVATPLGLGEAVALASRFDQVALFWYDGARFWLLPANADAAPHALP